MCPEMKKFKVMTMYRSEVTSRNQNPTIPTLTSKKKPTRNDSTSETAKAASVSGSGNPSKKPRQTKNSRSIGHERHDDVRDLVGDPVDEQVADHVDGLDQVALHRPFADLAGDAAGQAGHAGEHPADVGQQQVGDHLAVAERRRARSCRDPVVDRLPEQDGGHHRQEAEDRAEQEIAAVGHPLGERDAEDRQYFGQPPARAAARRDRDAGRGRHRGGRRRGQAVVRARVASASGGVMGGPGLLEDAGDDLFQRRLLHAHVGHGVAVEDRRQHLGDLGRARP